MFSQRIQQFQLFRTFILGYQTKDFRRCQHILQKTLRRMTCVSNNLFTLPWTVALTLLFFSLAIKSFKWQEYSPNLSITHLITVIWWSIQWIPVDFTNFTPSSNILKSSLMSLNEDLSLCSFFDDLWYK